MSRHLIVVDSACSLREVQKLMEAMRVRHVLVIDGKRLVGIVSNRDVLLASRRRAGRLLVPDMPVSRIMTEDVLTCSERVPVSDAASVMIERKIDCLPVMRGENVVGIVTATVLLRLLRGSRRDGSVLELAGRDMVDHQGAVRRVAACSH
jgi:acetoin utilization protein AcuB